MFNKQIINALIIVAPLVLAYPATAHAYVDPGVVGTFFQIIFILFFGTFFFWLTKPFKYIGLLIKKILGKLNKSKK